MRAGGNSCDGFACHGSDPARMKKISQLTLDCVHCGLCLPTCPTYRETGNEIASPRGRIYLMRGVVENRIEFSELVLEAMDLCLGCRACETACPSGVRFEDLLETMRAEARGRGLHQGIAKRIEIFVLQKIVPNRRRLRFVVNVLHGLQRFRVLAALRLLLPSRWQRRIDFLPPIAPPRLRAPLATSFVARGKRRARVGYFVGCVLPEFFGSVQRASLHVLAQNGFEVIVPDTQVCCGALHAHSGDLETARELLEQNVRAFRDAQVEYVIVDSAGCGAALRDCENWLCDDGEGSTASPRQRESWSWLAHSIRDISEFLYAQGIEKPSREMRLRVCYDDSCHLFHGQRVVDAPRALLRQIPGLQLVEQEDAAACCGAAGIYNLTHPEMADAVWRRKLASIERANPDVVVTGNPGCLLQFRAGFAQRGLSIRTLHPIEILAEAYSRQE